MFLRVCWAWRNAVLRTLDTWYLSRSYVHSWQSGIRALEFRRRYWEVYEYRVDDEGQQRNVIYRLNPTFVCRQLIDHPLLLRRPFYVANKRAVGSGPLAMYDWLFHWNGHDYWEQRAQYEEDWLAVSANLPSATADQQVCHNTWLI